MIKVNLSKETIDVKGHAGFAKKGEDIVCASVSTAVTMCINQIELFDMLDHIEFILDEGNFHLHIVNNNDVLEKIIKNLVYTLSDLEITYPKYIKISEN